VRWSPAVFAGECRLPDLVPFHTTFSKEIDDRIQFIKGPDHLEQFSILLAIFFPDYAFCDENAHIPHFREVIGAIAAETAIQRHSPVHRDELVQAGVEGEEPLCELCGIPAAGMAFAILNIPEPV
jgi:hypothetical protein